jgi:adenosylhomocysteine nucleosidase
MWLRLLTELFLRETVLKEVRRQVTSAAMEAAAASTSAPRTNAERLPVDVLLPFALSAESGALVDLMTEVTKTRCDSFLEYDGLIEVHPKQPPRRIVVVDTGVGTKAATIATEESLKLHKPKWVISAGFGGGLVEPLRRGHFLLATDVASDMLLDGSVPEPIELGWKFDPGTLGPSVHLGRLVTVSKLLGKESEKRSAGERTGALACDMESYAVATACRKHGTRLLSIRIISDAVEDELPPEIERLLNKKTLAAKLGAATSAVMGRPSAVQDLWQLHQDSIKASHRLAKFVVSMMQGLNSP